MMFKVRIFLLLIFVGSLCVHANPAESKDHLKKAILSELAFLEENSDEYRAALKQNNWLVRKIASRNPRALVAHEKTMPTLYNLVKNVAAKLRIAVPLIVVNKYHDICAESLYHNFSILEIGKQAIEKLSLGELEAYIVHQLVPVRDNTWKAVPFVLLACTGKAMEHVPFVGKRIYEKCRNKINDMLLGWETQAELGTVALIDDPQVFQALLDHRYFASARFLRWKKEWDSLSVLERRMKLVAKFMESSSPSQEDQKCFNFCFTYANLSE